jgi:hypothetical protein
MGASHWHRGKHCSSVCQWPGAYLCWWCCADVAVGDEGAVIVQQQQSARRTAGTANSTHMYSCSLKVASCKLCSIEGAPQERQVAVLARTGLSSNVEDLKHFLLEFPAYDDLRAVCPAFPVDVYTTLSNPGCVAAVMGHSAQAALANTLFHMKVRRSELLELPWV